MRIHPLFRLIPLFCLALVLSACGMSERGGPWWEPQEHVLELEPGTMDKSISLPAGDYLTIELPLFVDQPVSDDVDYSPRLMHYAGFRHSPGSKRDLSQGKNGKFVFSFITRDPGKAEIVIYRMAPNKKPLKTELPYARLTVEITSE